MKTATLISLSMHAAAVAGVYCLAPYGAKRQELYAINIVYQEPVSAAKASSQPQQKKVKVKTFQKSIAQKQQSAAASTASMVSSTLNQNQPCSHSCLSSFSASALNMHPQYPELARQRGIEGKAMFRLHLDHKGSVIKATIIEGDLHPLLFNEASKTLMAWRFNGRVPAFVDVPISFNLTEN